MLVLNGNSFTGNFPTFLTSIDSLKGLYLEGSTLTRGAYRRNSATWREGDLDTLGLEYCVILQLPPGAIANLNTTTAFRVVAVGLERQIDESGDYGDIDELVAFWCGAE